jgi:hypothetical protein
MDTNALSDPQKIGPGIWFTLHFLAINALTNDEIEHIIKFIEQLALEFPCEDCAKHFQEYLEKNPITKTLNFDKDADFNSDELFKWVNAFHNAVNIRTQKTPVQHEEVQKFYALLGDYRCIDCGNKSINNKSNNNKSINNKSISNKSINNKSISNKSINNKSNNNKSINTARNISYNIKYDKEIELITQVHQPKKDNLLNNSIIFNKPSNNPIIKLF